MTKVEKIFVKEKEEAMNQAKKGNWYLSNLL